MTIKQYLFRLEHIHYRRERKFERYMRLSAAASSPRSSLNLDGMPHGKGGANGREKLLERSAVALDEYYKADEELYNFERQYTDVLGQLDYSERILLEILYIDNRGRPAQDRIRGIYERLGLKRSQIPTRVKAAESHLIEILKMKGIDIEE